MKIAKGLEILKNAFYHASFIYFIIVLFILLVFIIAWAIANSIGINQTTVGLLNVSCSVILAVITALYAYFTYMIVNQSTKAQKIAFAEKRLEYFYYPLDDFLKSYIRVIKVDGARHLRVSSDIYPVKNRTLNPVYIDVAKHKYLAEKLTKNTLDSFLSIISKKPEVIEKKDMETYDNLMLLIQGDIEKLLEELDRLLNEK